MTRAEDSSCNAVRPRDAVGRTGQRDFETTILFCEVGLNLVMKY